MCCEEFIFLDEGKGVKISNNLCVEKVINYAFQIPFTKNTRV